MRLAAYKSFAKGGANSGGIPISKLAVVVGKRGTIAILQQGWMHKKGNGKLSTWKKRFVQTSTLLLTVPQNLVLRTAKKNISCFPDIVYCLKVGN